VPASDGGDDLVRVLCPTEGLWVGVCLCDEAFDGCLQGDQGVEHASLQAALGQFGKEALDGIDPGGRGWREVEGEAGMPPEPLDDLGVLVGGVVVEHDVDLFARLRHSHNSLAAMTTL